MANKTIYVKDDELWERAKQLVGKDGLSALLSEMLQNYVKRKDVGPSEQRFNFQIGHWEDTDETDQPDREHIEFIGRRLGDVEVGARGEHTPPHSVVIVYQT